MTLETRQVANHEQMEKAGDYFMLNMGEKRIAILWCPFCEGRYELGGENDLGIINHTIESENPLSVSPSVVNPETKCHFWIKNGVITNC